VLLGGVDDPVDTRIATDCGVSGIDQDHFEVFVESVLGDPVAVENSQVATSLANTAFSESSQVSLGLDSHHTLVAGFAVHNTLLDGFLAVTTSHSHSVDDVALFGLVSETTSLVRSGRTRCSVNDGQLSVFPSADTEQEACQEGYCLRQTRQPGSHGNQAQAKLASSR